MNEQEPECTCGKSSHHSRDGCGPCYFLEIQATDIGGEKTSRAEAEKYCGSPGDYCFTFYVYFWQQVGQQYADKNCKANAKLADEDTSLFRVIFPFFNLFIKVTPNGGSHRMKLRTEGRHRRGKQGQHE